MCSRALTFLGTAAFTVAGFTLFIIGLTIHIAYEQYTNFLDQHLGNLVTVTMVVGAALFFVSILGCCGAMKESACMICTYVMLSSVLFICELCLVYAIFANYIELRPLVEQRLNTSIQEYNERREYRDGWNMLQSEFNCCGKSSPNDWADIFPNSTLPAACCPVINLNEATTCTVLHANSEGCYTKLIGLMESKTLRLDFILLGVLTFQMLTICIAHCLIKSLR